MNAKKLVLVFLHFFVPINGFLYFRYGSINCTSNSIICTSETTFKFCFRIGNYVVHLNEEITCESGFVCSEINHFPCVPSNIQIESTNEITTENLTTFSSTTQKQTSSSSTSSSITTPATFTTPEATTTVLQTTSTTVTTPIAFTITTSKTPTTSTTKTTSVPKGTTTSNITTQEITSTTSPLISSSTTTTIQPIVEPPDCKGASGFYPSSKCNQYYECSAAFLWWWYEPHLKTCPDGQAYNGKNDCEPSTTCNISIN